MSRRAFAFVAPKHEVPKLVQEGLITMEGGVVGIVPTAVPELLRRGFIKSIPAEVAEAISREEGEAQLDIDTAAAKAIKRVREQDKEISDAEAVRFIAERLLTQALETLDVAMNRLVQLKEQNKIELISNEHEAFVMRTHLLLREIMANYQPLKMRPWVFLELIYSKAQELEESRVAHTPQGREQEDANTNLR